MAYTGEPGDQAQPAWVHEIRSCLSNLISFCDKVTCLVDEGKAGDVVYLDLVNPLTPQHSPGEIGCLWLG